MSDDALVIEVPPLAGTRSGARDLVDRLGQIDGRIVVVHCRRVLSAAPGFTDELLRQVLVVGHAAEMLTRAAPAQMGRDFLDSALAHGVADRMRELTVGDYVAGE